MGSGRSDVAESSSGNGEDLVRKHDTAALGIGIDDHGAGDGIPDFIQLIPSDLMMKNFHWHHLTLIVPHFFKKSNTNKTEGNFMANMGRIFMLK
jgi:hypothetical protein